MERPLHSERWHHVAGLRPHWRMHARSDRQAVRGATWHVVRGDGRAGTLRLDATAWSIVGRFDGRRTMQAVWDEALAENPAGAPTQDETIELLARLVDERCLACEGLPDVTVLRNDDRSRASRRLAGRLNPLALRLSLGDPTPLLRLLEPLARHLFSPAGAFAWLVLVAIAASLALSEPDAILRHAASWAQSPRNLLLATLVWLPMKAVHEAAHALAVCRWGGAVREAGLVWMLGLPVPYVDASAADRFAASHERAAVAAAGILAELALAALGLVAWAMTEPGWVHDTGFAVAMAGTTSTLLFNGNPLMRMDGYFVLCDLAGLPNLATRSGTWWRAALQRALGWADAPGTHAAAGERVWLVAYAPLAWGWRLGLMASLALWAGSHHRLLGAAVALLAAWWLLGVPLRALVSGPSEAGASLGARWRVRLRLAAVLAGLAAIAVLLPLPDRTVAPGLVRMPDDARIRAGVEGFVVTAQAGRDVVPGEVVLRLDDPALRRERDRLLQARPGLQTELFAHLRSDPARALEAREALIRLEAALASIDEKLSHMRVVATVSGRFEVERPGDLPGRFVREGDELGVLTGGAPVHVRVALDQDEAARLRAGVRTVELRLAEAPGRVLAGRLVRQAPAAVDTLPGAALGERFGGTIPVDAADEDGTKPTRPTYVVDVAFDDALEPPPRPGGRAWVRFDHGNASLVEQAVRWLRQTVRSRFAPDAL
jgi:putative peptide zinc metalloprotease protein